MTESQLTIQPSTHTLQVLIACAIQEAMVVRRVDLRDAIWEICACAANVLNPRSEVLCRFGRGRAAYRTSIVDTSLISSPLACSILGFRGGPPRRLGSRKCFYFNAHYA